MHNRVACVFESANSVLYLNMYLYIIIIMIVGIQQLDHWGGELGLLPLRHVVKFFRSLPTEILNTTRYAARWGWGQHSKNCVSLHVSPWTDVSCRIHWLHLCWGVRPPNECPEYNTKQSDGEVPVMLWLWGMRSTPSLPFLPGPLWHGVVASNRALSMG